MVLARPRAFHIFRDFFLRKKLEEHLTCGESARFCKSSGKSKAQALLGDEKTSFYLNIRNQGHTLARTFRGQ
jgi:alpha-galactosidase/6-phospho-beta-glucosidase family protein